MRSSRFLLAFASLALAGCPNEVIVSSGGAGGSTPGTTSIATASSVNGSTSSGTSECVSAADCPPPTDVCSVPICVDGACSISPSPDGVACDDHDACTTDDVCAAGTCAGKALMCPGMGGCTTGVCDPESGTCTVVPVDEGGPCDDLDPCTSDGVCTNGTCAPGPPLDCSAFTSACGVGSCGPNGCFAAPINEGASCNDGQACTLGDHCQAGACVGGGPKQCTSSDPCKVASCDAQTGNCVLTAGNDGAACNVPGSCKTGMTCLMGTCQGGVAAPLYFYDDFHDASKGWTLGTEWQIGPAVAGPPPQWGNADPATDHTNTNDNGIAGVVIGGNASTTVHPFRYLTSPVIDTSSANGQVFLSFYRWLNSDFDAWMHNTVDVWNGSEWVNVYTSSGVVQDSAWTVMIFDITAYKGPQLKVRFGFDVSNTGTFGVSSWNIDDVRVADTNCG